MHFFVEILKVWNGNQNLRIGVINGQINPTQYATTGFIVKFRAWRRLVFNTHWSVCTVEDDAKIHLILSSLKDKEERKMTVVLVFVVRWRRWYFMFPRFIYHHFWEYEIEFYMFSYSLFFTSIFKSNFWTRMDLCECKEQKTESSLCHTQGGMLQWRQSLRGKPSCTETLNQWKKPLLHHQRNSQHKGKMVQATTLIQSMCCWPWTSKGWRRPLIIKLSVTLHSRTNLQFFRHEKE